jgi:two-component system, sensor histidine kinase and response regulator
MEGAKYNLKKWKGLVEKATLNSHALCVALFQVDPPRCMFANQAMEHLLRTDKPWEGLINPDFARLSAMTGEGLVFKGLLTIGDSLSMNTTIEACIYRQGNEILLTGEINLLKMLDQNTKMARLNQEISNLQRNLVKEKMILANILDELKQANQQLALLNEEKNRFISMAAHDLRSPVSTALSYTDIMLNNEGIFPKEKNLQFLRVIEERLGFALKLMSELLDLGKIESGSLKLNLQKNDFLQLLEKTIRFHRMVADMKKISIFLDCTEESLLFAFDKEKMEQVLNNLISNAIKYSAPATHVQVKTERHQNEVRTWVIDQGVGIKESELSQIFHAFQKSSSVPTAGESSTGLGLVIAKKIVEEHGGVIGVESEENKGSSFYFTIPWREEIRES